MPLSNKGLGRCHKSETGNYQGRQRTTPRDNRGFNCNDCHSKSNELSLPVISVSLPLNNSVINPPQLSLVCQHSSRSSHNTPSDNQCLNRNHSNSNSNDFSSPVIPMLPPCNDSVINPTHLSSVRQQSSSSHITQRMSCKLLQYPVGILLICQITCHRCQPRMEVAIFMDAWLMCLS